jgi:hypothetical protein
MDHSAADDPTAVSKSIDVVRPLTHAQFVFDRTRHLSLVRLTAKQLNQLEYNTQGQPVFAMHGVFLVFACLVGVVRSKRVTSQYFELILDDKSGQCRIRFYNSNGSPNHGRALFESIVLHTVHYRVTGRVVARRDNEGQEERKDLEATQNNIVPMILCDEPVPDCQIVVVDNDNELTYHSLRCAADSLRVKELGQKQSQRLVVLPTVPPPTSASASASSTSPLSAVLPGKQASSKPAAPNRTSASFSHSHPQSNAHSQSQSQSQSQSNAHTHTHAHSHSAAIRQPNAKMDANKQSKRPVPRAFGVRAKPYLEGSSANVKIPTDHEFIRSLSGGSGPPLKKLKSNPR